MSKRKRNGPSSEDQRKLASLREEIRPALDEMEARGKLALQRMQADVERAERRAARVQRRRTRRRRIAFAISAAVFQLFAFFFARTADQRIRQAERDARLLGERLRVAFKLL